MREKSFTFYLCGTKNNDALVRRYLNKEEKYKDIERLFFKLEYTPPYHKFCSIREFQYETKYKPFGESNRKMAVAVIDVADWIGHEEEEYLEIFFQFLHDFQQSFHTYEFIFTVADAAEEEVGKLLLLAAQYLADYRIVEDRTLANEAELTAILKEEYPIDSWLAKGLAHIFVEGQVKGISQLRTLMMDFVSHVKKGKKGIITGREVMKDFTLLEESKIGLFYEKELARWKKEYILCAEKEDVA